MGEAAAAGPASRGSGRLGDRALPGRDRGGTITSDPPIFDPDQLTAALAKLPAAAWGQPQPDSEPTNPRYRLASLVVAGRPKPAASLFRFVLDAFAPVWAAWVAEVPARGFIAPHVDQGPYRERWHVPIQVAGTFNGREVQAGVSFPVRHWEPHRVDNPTDRPRVHLVLDRGEVLDVPAAPFQRIEV